jgi:hypothetical protein
MYVVYRTVKQYIPPTHPHAAPTHCVASMCCIRIQCATHSPCMEEYAGAQNILNCCIQQQLMYSTGHGPVRSETYRSLVSLKIKILSL